MVHETNQTCRVPSTLRVKITCPKSTVLLSRFAASITRIHCVRAQTTVEDHGCTGKGRYATRTTTQHFSRPMPLLLLYRAPSFGCSSFFVYRGLCKNRSIDVRGRTQCLHMNLYVPQLLYSSCKFGQVFLTRTVCVLHVYTYREALTMCVLHIQTSRKPLLYSRYNTTHYTHLPCLESIDCSLIQRIHSSAM